MGSGVAHVGALRPRRTGDRHFATFMIVDVPVLIQ
jgi:hypothetical protein